MFAGLRLLLLGIVLACPWAIAQQGGDAQMLALVTQTRERGCAGHAGSRTPLHWSGALARAATHMEGGQAPFAAVEKEGYRATRVFHAKLDGYHSQAEVAAALAQHYCAALAEPQFRDFGYHRQGAHWLLVLAAPLEFPQLADGRAAAQRVLTLVNEARARPRRCGERPFSPAPPLRWNPQLERAAELHAQDMAAHGYVEHRGRDGSTPAQRIARAGYYPWHSIGENVAAGQGAPEEVVEDWLSSPGHCANLMEPTFAEMGAAFTVNMASKGVVYWAQEFGTR
jgi:uncharacterized protein YkwD